MTKVHYTLKNKLVEQSLKEIAFDTEYRDNKTKEEWKKNEQLLKAYEASTLETKSKIPLFQAIAFEETLLSKIDNSLTWKMQQGGLEDKKKAEKFNALRERDSKLDRWDSKDRSGKRHNIRYGRSIYVYTAASVEGYKPNLQQIRPRFFHIDPDAGGLDIEKAMHLGWYGVKKTLWQLRQGIKSGEFDKKSTEELIAMGSNYNENIEEETYEQSAGNDASHIGKNKKITNENIWIFYQHFTYDYDTGEKYVLLLTKEGHCIRCKKWIEVDPSDMTPVWTWATSPDDAEFWSIAPLSRVRRMFKGMEKSINQMIDNSDRVNNPKLAVNVDFIRNLAQAKYGTGGFLEVTGNVDADRAVKAILTPSIDTPMKVFDKLQSIVDRESGVTAQAAGVSDEDGVLGIYDGNKENLGDRLGLLNKEYSEGYYRFALLWKNGVRHNLKSKVAIRILGIHGIGIEEILWADIKPNQHDYDILIESSAAETQMSEIKTKSKMELLASAKGDQLYNQKVVREKEIEITGFSEDDKRSLLDTRDGSEGMLVKAYEDFEKLVEGREVVAPRQSNLEYVQALNDLWEEKDDLITKMYSKNKPKASETHSRIQAYIAEVQMIAEKNEAVKVLMEQAKNGDMDTTVPEENPQGNGGDINPDEVVDPTNVGLPQEMLPTEPVANTQFK